MMVFLIAVRDALLVMALAWVGVTLEQRTDTERNNACSAERQVCE